MNTLPDKTDQTFANVQGVDAAFPSRATIVAEAHAAVRRLVSAIFTAESDQAMVLVTSLASIYKGVLAPKVCLDRITILDWPLRRDLTVVLLGSGEATFDQAKIREAFASHGRHAHELLRRFSEEIPTEEP